MNEWRKGERKDGITLQKFIKNGYIACSKNILQRNDYD